MNEIKLKPYPFCGGKAEFGTNVLYKTIWVYCKKCKVNTMNFESDLYLCATENVAKAWNKRTETANHSKWNLSDSYKDENGDLVNMYSCSCCNILLDEATNYCSNCGAKMDGVMKMGRDIESRTEYGKDGKQYLVVTKRGRLARDDICEIVRQYELARLRHAAHDKPERRLFQIKNGGNFMKLTKKKEKEFLEKIRTIRELEQQKKQADEKIDELKGDSKALKAADKELYRKYLKSGTSKRFSIT